MTVPGRARLLRRPLALHVDTTAAVATLKQASGELAAKAEELQALVARS